MLSRERVIRALADQRDAFEHYEQRAGQERERYEAALAWFAAQSREEIERLLEGCPRPGARPTAERVAGRAPVLPFSPRWANHEEARAWALGVLQGVTTVAVDGSQISPSFDYSVPVGAAQVGWFVNPHDGAGRYIKDIAYEIVPPDLLTEAGEEEAGFPDLEVNLRRFEMECATLCEWMARLAAGAARAVCLLDGSLTVSFAGQLRPSLRARYVQAILGVIETSQRTRVPVVGYVDGSRAKDFVTLLARLHDYDPPRLNDAQLLRPRMAWGQRTEAFICARDDALARDDPAQDYYSRVHFVYLKTTAANPPARLDVPAWVLEAGQLEWVMDVARAECIVGVGYPYAAETADAVAVITAQDREQFYHVFQKFLADLGQDLRYARKAYSKRVRR